MAPVIEVYSKPNCQQCTATTKLLDRQGLPYRYFDVTEQPDALDRVRILGYQSVPVVLVGDVHWGGFRPDRIKALADVYATAAEDTAGLEDSALEFLTTDAAS